MNDQNLTDTGYSVYLLYQKEVYSSDHSFMQSMMEWLYASVDSPLKFYFRNKAQVNITHNGILIQKENSINSRTKDDVNTWNHIFFNFRHLKEIYVDKRHKDTCVLVSKVSSSTQSNNVWRKSNPSNYESFRFAYSMNKAYKKSFLLTILKFKDGPTRLLQSIQLLDSVLVDYNKREELINKNLKNNSQLNNIMLNSIKTSDKNNRKATEPSQFYSNIVKSTSRNSMDSVIKIAQNLNEPSYDTVSLNRLRNRSQQSFDHKPSRNHSIDKLFQNLNASTTSLHNFQSNFLARSTNSITVSRQSSINDLRTENAPLVSSRGFLANDFTTNSYDYKPQDNKLIVRPSNLNHLSNVQNHFDNGKNIRIKLVNESNNFESNISESSENDETESNRQIETVIEKKRKEDDTTRNDYDDTFNTNTLIEDFSLNNNNNNTETMNDLDTLNYDFSNQNSYINTLREDTKSKPLFNSTKISNSVKNTSSTTGKIDTKEIKSSSAKVKDIINSFNNLTNLNKNVDLDSFDQAKDLASNKLTSVTNLKIGNGLPPPVKIVNNDYSFNKTNISLTRPSVPLNYMTIKPEHPSLTLNVNPVDSLNNFYSGNYFTKNDSINNLNNDINLINNKLTQIVNLLSGSENFESKCNDKINEATEKKIDEIAKNKTNLTSLPVATVAPIKKRTFANMVWPMDPEEEKILRSASPFIVPEIIMQKPERVKSILKKSNSYLTNSTSGYDLTSYVNQSMTKSSSTLTNYNLTGVSQSPSSMSAKKRVDFHENFCYVNFFDKNEDH